MTNEREEREPERQPEQPAAQADGEAMLWCPTCSTRLQQSRCKLICPQCGYYMSCADYY